MWLGYWDVYSDSHHTILGYKLISTANHFGKFIVKLGFGIVHYLKNTTISLLKIHTFEWNSLPQVDQFLLLLRNFSTNSGSSKLLSWKSTKIEIGNFRYFFMVTKSINVIYFIVLVELMILLWGIRLCIMVRKAPSEFNESRFISMTIYNEFLLSIFLNVSM